MAIPLFGLYGPWLSLAATGSIPTGIVPTGTVPTSATPGHYTP